VQSHARNGGTAGRPPAEPEEAVIAKLKSQNESRDGPREKLSEENIEKIRKVLSG